MGNTLIAEVEIQGSTALLWHHFAAATAIPTERTRERVGVRGHDPTEWEHTVLIDENRQLYLPGGYVFGSLRDGAKYTKRGRGSIQSAVVASLRVLSDRVLVDRRLPATLTTDPSAPVYLDVRMVVNPVTRGRNIRYRVAAAPGWRAGFQIAWDATIVSRNELQAVAIDAGRFIGLGSGRQIGLGRYEIVTFGFHER